MRVLTLLKEIANNENVMSEVMVKFIVWKLVCWVFVYCHVISPNSFKNNFCNKKVKLFLSTP
jgi:hypothetical protein